MYMYITYGRSVYAIKLLNLTPFFKGRFIIPSTPPIVSHNVKGRYISPEVLAFHEHSPNIVHARTALACTNVLIAACMFFFLQEHAHPRRMEMEMHPAHRSPTSARAQIEQLEQER